MTKYILNIISYTDYHIIKSYSCYSLEHAEEILNVEHQDITSYFPELYEITTIER